MMILQDNRPALHDYALLAEHVYHDAGDQGVPDNWEVDFNIVKGEYEHYIFRTYVNRNLKHIVFASRGTANRDDYRFDVSAFIWKHGNAHERKRVTRLKECIDQLIDYAMENCYHISFTGHSLGGWFSELAMAMIYFHVESVNVNSMHVNAVTFDSPGGKYNCIKWLYRNIFEALDYFDKDNTEHQREVNEMALDWMNGVDVANIMFPANMVNTSCQHTDSAYYAPTIFASDGISKTLEKHSMNGMVRYSESEQQKLSVAHLTPVSLWYANMRRGRVGRCFGLRTQNKATNRFRQLSELQTHNNPDGADFHQLSFPSPPTRGVVYFEKKDYGDIQFYNGALMESRHFNIELRRSLLSFYKAKLRGERFSQQSYLYQQFGMRIIFINYLLSFDLYNKDLDGSYVLISDTDTIWDGLLKVNYYSVTAFEFRQKISRSRFTVNDTGELVAI